MADNVSITEGSGKTVAADEISSVLYQRVKITYGDDGSATDVSATNALPVTGTITAIDRVKNVSDGTISLVTRVDRVHNVVDGTISFIPTVQRVQNLVDGTITFIPTVQRVQNLVDGTISTLDTLARVNRVHNLVDGTLSLLTRADRIMNLVDGTLSTITRVDRVMNIVDGTISLPSTQDLDTITRVDRVMNVVDGTLSTVTGITNTVNIKASDGTFAVYFSPASPTVIANTKTTGAIFTVSGSTSGGTTSGVTLISPSANYNFKIYAFSLQTTGVVSGVWRFTNGGESATEFWRGLITAASSSSAPVGANLTGERPLFETGVNTTLALRTDTASLVHYSVSYIKESA